MASRMIPPTASPSPSRVERMSVVCDSAMPATQTMAAAAAKIRTTTTMGKEPITSPRANPPEHYPGEDPFERRP